MVALHASGGTPALFEYHSRWNPVARAHGFVVAYLGSAAPAWKFPSNVAYIRSQIKRLVPQQNIDPRRIYVTGFSAGAYISYFVGCRLSGLVAAIGPVSAGMLPQPCRISAPVSELTIMGTSDIIPVTGNKRFPAVATVASFWRKLDGCPRESPQATQVGPTRQQVWGGCAKGSAVGLYIIRSGQHVYPDSPGDRPGSADAVYNATSALWAFFAAHPRQ